MLILENFLYSHFMQQMKFLFIVCTSNEQSHLSLGETRQPNILLLQQKFMMSNVHIINNMIRVRE